MKTSARCLESRKACSAFNFLWLSFVLVAGVIPARATIIFNQPHDGSSTLYQSSVWDPDGSDYDQWQWDRFSFTTDQAVTAVNWRGGGSGAAIVSFDVAIYASIPAGTEPDLGYLYSGPLVHYVVDGTPGQTYAGTFGGVAMYDYHYVLPSPFQATANTYYWVYIVANQSGMPTWGLASAGAGSHFRCISAAGDHFYQIVSGDMAFSLEGSSQSTVNIAATASPVGWGTVQGAGAYPIGSLVSLTAIPAAGYGFVNWTENNVTVSNSITYSFTATVDRTLVAHFTPAYTVTTSSLPQAGGTTSGGGIFNQGSSVTVSAVPASGYNFTAWLEGGAPVSTSADYTFTIGYGRNLVAQFTPTAATALFDFDTGIPPVSPGQSMPASQMNSGLTAYFTALGMNSWFIQNSFLYGWVPSNFSGNFLYPTGTFGAIQIIFSHPLNSLHVEFCTAENTGEYDIASQVRIRAYSGSINNPQIGNALGQGDWISGAYPQGSVTFSSSTAFDVITIDIPTGQGYPVSGYLFVDNIIAQEAPPQNYTISAVANPANGGAVSGAGSYAAGSLVTLTASDNTGYGFIDWTEAGSPVSSDSVYTFTATADRSLTANFVPYVSIVTSGLSADGMAYGDGSYALGQMVEVRAVPRTGRAFLQWEENGSPISTSAAYRFTAATPRTLTAIFEPDTLSATFDFDTGLPSLNDGDALPASQSSGGWSATFSAAPGAFTVESDASLAWSLTRMGGHYLTPASSPSVLDVVFDRPVSSVVLSFATMDWSPNSPPSMVRLTAWSDPGGTQPAGETTIAGVIKPGDALPTGAIGLQAETIQRIRIDMPTQPSGVTDFVVDNISARAIPKLLISYRLSTDPSAVMLTWAAPCSGYALQKAADSANPAWQPVTEPVQLVGNEYRVIVPLNADRSFYRLVHP